MNDRNTDDELPTDDEQPAILNPPTWGVVARLADAVGANAKTPWLVTFTYGPENDEATVITSTLRGSDEDGYVGVESAESGNRRSVHVSEISRVAPIVDDEGEPLPRDLDYDEIWNRMDLNELLRTVDARPVDEAEFEEAGF